MIEILGVDMWGTIRRLDTEDMIPEAFSALQQLVSKRFSERVWLVSAARTGEESLNWLKEQNFYGKTGILPEHVKFCRLGEKPSLCDKLGVTHIIDDNDFVLTRVNTAQYRYLFHVDDDGSLKILMPEDKLKKIQIVTSWKEILNILLPKNRAGRE